MNSEKANAICKTEGCKHNKRQYDILTFVRDKILADQNNSCDICKKPISFETGTAQVDHCHTSGNVRGVLCFRCNTTLVGFDNNVIILENAIKYIRKSLE